MRLEEESVHKLVLELELVMVSLLALKLAVELGVVMVSKLDLG